MENSLASGPGTKTIGIDPKLIIQAGTTIIVFLIAHFAKLDLDESVEGAIAVLLGALAGYLGPPADVVPIVEPVEPDLDENIGMSE